MRKNRLNINIFKNDLLLLLAAAIWGFAFVAQRVGMRYIGPFTFNGIRFALGSLTLIPLIIFRERRKNKIPNRASAADSGANVDGDLENKVTLKGGTSILLYGLIAGSILFSASSFQQIGIVYTTAGKAGFITGLYVVLVPLTGLFWGQKAGAGRWIGAILATVGLYFLSVTSQFTIEKGDLLVLISAFFWTAHVQVIGLLSPKTDPIKLASTQFAVCSILSTGSAFAFETVTISTILKATIPLLYGGLLSAGIAFTIQVVAQQKAHPAHAAIIMSMESVFAVIGGWIILGETLSPRGLLGSTLMLTGMILSQIAMVRGAVKNNRIDRERLKI